MARISIERHDTHFAGQPFWAQHLYLVYESDRRAEYVVRAGPDGGFLGIGVDMRIEANVPIEQSADARGGESPAARSSTELEFDGRTADAAWGLIVRYARMIDNAGYGYNLLRENSNAFVGAMISAAGGDPETMLPTGMDASSAVGLPYWTSIVADISPPPNGNLVGTNVADTLRGIQIDDVILGLGGNDIILCGDGDDIARGGTGADRINGQRDDDRLFGDAGDDLLQGAAGEDRLFGQAGNDRHFGGAGNDLIAGGPGADLVAGGTGDDLLYGGAGPDRFDFAANEGRDIIGDFEDGVDLLRIRAAGIDEYDDLVVRPAGDDVWLAFAGTTLLLKHTDFDAFGPADVLILPADALA